MMRVTGGRVGQVWGQPEGFCFKKTHEDTHLFCLTQTAHIGFRWINSESECELWILSSILYSAVVLQNNVSVWWPVWKGGVITVNNNSMYIWRVNILHPLIWKRTEETGSVVCSVCHFYWMAAPPHLYSQWLMWALCQFYLKLAWIKRWMSWQ